AHRRKRSVCSASRYELVPPPAPNTVARPATLGACQVRLQLSMLLLPRTVRLNFWAAKLTSLVALLQLKVPKVVGPWAAFAAWNPATTRSSASSQVAGRRSPPFVSRTRGWVSRTYGLAIRRSPPACVDLPSVRRTETDPVPRYGPTVPLTEPRSGRTLRIDPPTGERGRPPGPP